MIEISDKLFHISTVNTSYIFKIMQCGQVENLYYGKKIKIDNTYPIEAKQVTPIGTSVYYSIKSGYVILDNTALECSAIGKGDYKEPFIMIKNADGSIINDFLYESFEIFESDHVINGMPSAYGDNGQTLEITLVDKAKKLKLKLFYTIFSDSDVIVKSSEIINESENTVSILKIMSSQLDLPDCNYDFLTLDGTWIRERYINIRPLAAGIVVNDSKCGISSSYHNPYCCLIEHNAQLDNGNTYGFNLIYSGNHYTAVEVNSHGKTHIINGINPFNFEWKLEPNKHFESPAAVICYSDCGSNGLSQCWHNFVNNHIVRGEWQNKPRPILINNWEATYFDFNESKILSLAHYAAKNNIELFVLDDGWFGDRTDDTKSLGDWFVNKKKLPSGLNELSKKINAMGMKFGLWFEPEMINENSDLYRTHPDWAVKHPDYEASLCRNQMLLDYTNPLVTDYIKKQLSIILESANIDYVKWDFNRPMSDFYSTTLFNQGEFFHRYMRGLYDVLDYLTKKFPYILFESCASGGSRVDLGMLCFMPQFWTSDNTDSFDRFLIQEGTSLCYPLSSIGAHVSASLNHQTLRKSRISTRFNTACFGAFGYELNLNTLSNKDISNIEKQVEFYKLYRPVFQYGDFYRLVDVFKEDYGGWIVISKDKTIAFALLQNKIAPTNPPLKILKTKGLNDNFLYSFSAIIEDINIKTFGSLINLVSPVKLKENGLIHNIADKFYYLKTESDSFTAYGSLLNNAGVKLSREWSGSGYNDNVRLMQDFGSRLYIIKSIKQI